MEKFGNLANIPDGPAYPLKFHAFLKRGVGEFNSTPARRVYSMDPGDEVEVGVGGNDLLDVVVDHGCRMEGVSCIDLGVGFQKFDR